MKTTTAIDAARLELLLTDLRLPAVKLMQLSGVSRDRLQAFSQQCQNAKGDGCHGMRRFQVGEILSRKNEPEFELETTFVIWDVY